MRYVGLQVRYSLHNVVGLTAMDVVLILSVWIGAGIAVSFEVGLKYVGRVERALQARHYVRCNDVFIFG
ncbi:MAG TPA: hypothetical protein VIX60_02655 [Candidatus Cybelea sp.]